MVFNVFNGLITIISSCYSYLTIIRTWLVSASFLFYTQLQQIQFPNHSHSW